MKFFSSIVGQPRATTILQQALSNRRLHHAYLFEGPEGVGKRTTALRLAQIINCDSGGCGECESCHKIASGNHPDVFLFDMTPKGLSERVREFIGTLGFAPHEGRARVVIFDGAEDLAAGRAEAANILLKTLEEPPQRTHLILITAEAKRLPVTVRSRCQTVRFRPLDERSVVAWLTDRGHARVAAEAAARSANGSLTRALEELDGAEQSALRRKKIDALLDAARSGRARGIIDAAGEVGDREEAIELCRRLWLLLQRGVLLREGLSGDRLSAVQVDDLQSKIAGWSTAELLSSLHAIDDVIAALNGNVPSALGLEHLALQFAPSATGDRA